MPPILFYVRLGKMTKMSSRYLKRYATQWAGQFYVAAELTRKGYIVTFTLGNVPTTDLLVKSPEGKTFGVEVKSAKTKSICQLKEPPVPDNPEDLFWIFVSLLGDAQPVYCIIRSDEVLRLWHEYNDKFPADDKFQGIQWSTLREYQDQWDALPGPGP